MAGSVAFTCRTAGEAELILRAAQAYRREIEDRGDDPRNFAPAVPGEAAGFGWDTVIRAARDMGRGTVTHMSRRMAEGLRDAVRAYREQTANRDDGVHITEVAYRLDCLIDGD